MAIALDYTQRIPPAALKAAGVAMVCRYIAPGGSAWKTITMPEYRELTNAGIQVTLNWEYQATDWMGGAIAGRSHGKEAVRQAKFLGYPTGRVIVGSADFDMNRKQWDGPCESYASAFADTIRNAGYRPGVYGPSDVLGWVRDAGIMDAFWQAGMSTAWSGGRNRNVWNGAHFRQRGHKTVGGVDTDWNDILVSPLWGLTETPTKGDDDVLYMLTILRGTKDGNVSFTGTWSGTPESWHHLQTQQALDFWNGKSLPSLGSMWEAEAFDRMGIVLDTKQSNTGTSGITQEMLNAAVLANVGQIATALASHIKIS